MAQSLYVLVSAPTGDALATGVARVNTTIAEVLSLYRPAPPPPPPPAAEPPRVIVPVAASSAPAPAWGRLGAAPSATQPLDASDGTCEDCRICMAEVLADVRFEPCGHYACSVCCVDLRKRAIFSTSAGVPCPFCRTTITRYDAPPGVNIGLQARRPRAVGEGRCCHCSRVACPAPHLAQPSAAPEESLAFRATLPPLEIRRPPPAVQQRARAEVDSAHPRFKTSLCESWQAVRAAARAARARRMAALTPPCARAAWRVRLGRALPLCARGG